MNMWAQENHFKRGLELISIIMLLFALTCLGQARGGGSLPFKDLSSDHKAAGAVADLCERGIVKGYEDGTFRGEEKLSREEQVVLVACLHCYVYLREARGDQETEIDLLFQQAAGRVKGLVLEYEVPGTHWAYPAACYLADQMRKGWEPEILLPLEGFTRFEAAELVHNLLAQIPSISIFEATQEGEASE